MSYKSYKLLPFRQSPNYTPASQTRAIYGRPRTIELGAGHWWNTPESGATFAGVIATLMNPARQASANSIVTDGQVQEIVRDKDTSWATNQANPYTYSIEVDPRIMWKWTASGDKKKIGQRIFDTLCSYIADKGYHKLTWRPHNYWWQTACNPIKWGEVMAGAKAAYADKHKPSNPSKPVPAAKALGKTIKFKAKLATTSVWDLTTNPNYKAATTLKKGDVFEAVAYIDFNNTRYYVTKYSFDNKKKVGVNQHDLEEIKPAPVVPEWQKNLKDIKPVKLMVLTAQTPIVDLNTLAVIKQLGKGTYVDFTKSTTVKGVEYLVSSYSATNAMPNGIKRADVGVPAEPPKNEKPKWLEQWQDITDVVMYTRADTDLVNFEDGKTLSVIKRGTPIEVSSTTELFGHKYAITKYSTDRKEGRGIRLDDLSAKPVGNDEPAAPAPVQPEITEATKSAIMAAVDAFVAAIKKILGIK